jgi:MFS family permease
MKGFGRVLVLGAVLSAAPVLSSAHPLLAAALGVAAGILLAVVLSGAITPAAVGMGALGAVLYTAAAPLSVALAGALLVSMAYGARILRGRTPIAQALMTAAAFVCGGIAAWICWAYTDASWAVRGAALSVGALLAAAPLLISVDDRIAHRLRLLAERAAGARRVKLLRGVVLRRRYLDADYRLSRGTERRLERAYRALLATATSRLDGSGGQHAVLDQRIDAYVSALTNASRAAGKAHALSTGIDDAILAELRLEGEDLEAKAQALAEVS